MTASDEEIRKCLKDTGVLYKPIPVSEKYQAQSSDNLEFVNVTNEIETTEFEQIYTSRSGRQTKRKIYTDNFEDEEITKRSKLSSDPPERLSRAEQLFDLLKANDDKNRSARKMEDVDDKSKEVDKNDSDITPSLQEEDDDFVLKSKGLDSTRKRGPQSRRGRRNIGDEKKSNSSSQNSVSSAKSTSSISEPSTSNKQSEKPRQNKQICHICNKVFSRDEFDKHSSSCIALADTEICSVCDKEFVRHTDYEVHVRECIRKYNKQDKL